MAATILEESRSVETTPEATTITRVFKVFPYGEVLNVVGSLLGGVRQVAGALIRVPPARDPWRPWCFCQSVKEEGIGSISGSSSGSTDHLANRNGYTEGARLTATYKTLDYDASQEGQGLGPPEEIELASESFDFSAVQLTLPTKRYGWNDIDIPSNPILALLAKTGVAGVKTLPRIQYALTRHYVVKIPIKAITQQLGRLNKEQVRFGTTIWPKETVRFESLSAQRKVTTFGVKFFDVSYKFAIQPIWDRCAEGNEDGYVGWNRLFRPDTGKWQYVGLAADPTKRIYMLDQDGPSQTIRRIEWKGFNLLFHPWAQ